MADKEAVYRFFIGLLPLCIIGNLLKSLRKNQQMSNDRDTVELQVKVTKSSSRKVIAKANEIVCYDKFLGDRSLSKKNGNKKPCGNRKAARNCHFLNCQVFFA
jgi:hypothetical protein